MTQQKIPLVIGHRGASGSEPENTLRAFNKAIEMDADGVELDVFITRDQQLVVTHNNNTDLLTGEKMLVRRSLLKDLKQLDFGKGERIPTLAEVFECILKQSKVINVEIKSTGLRTDGIEKVLAEEIRRFRAQKKILVSSFNPLNLRRFHKIMPEVPIGYLMCPQQSVLVRNRRVVNRLKPQTLNLDQNLFDEKRYAPLLTYPHVWVWTVNTPEAMRRFVDLGVDAIITNYPDKLRKLLRAHV